MKQTALAVAISLLACLVRGETVESIKLFDGKVSSISGDTIVWLESTDTYNRILAKNLATEQEQVVIWSDQFLLVAPSIGGDLVAWEDWRLGYGCIYAKNLATGQEYQVATNDWWQYNAVVSANNVVAWLAPAKVLAKNLTTGQEYTVASVNPSCYWPWLLNPKISGDIVVFEEWTGEWTGVDGEQAVNLKGMNLATGKSFVVVQDKRNNSGFAVDGQTVVWRCPRGLVAKNLATGQEQVVYREGSCAGPAISGDTIVWLVNSGVIGKNIKAGRSFVFSSSHWVNYVLISGDRVVFDDRGGMYLAVIPPLPTLKIERSGDSVVLSWDSSNCILETKQSLSAPWQAVCSPSVSNCIYRAALSLTNAPVGFFRLQR
jgi:hypothetical protein